MKKPKYKQIPSGALITIKHMFKNLSIKSPRRTAIVRKYADRYGVSTATIYRALRRHIGGNGIKGTFRADKGKSRIPSLVPFIRIIFDLKMQARRSGKRLSTNEAIKMVESGLEIDGEFFKVSKGRFKKSTVNRYLKLMPEQEKDAAPKKEIVISNPVKKPVLKVESKPKPKNKIKLSVSNQGNPKVSPCKKCKHITRSRKECIDVYNCTKPQEYEASIRDNFLMGNQSPGIASLGERGK